MCFRKRDLRGRGIITMLLYMLTLQLLIVEAMMVYGVHLMHTVDHPFASHLARCDVSSTYYCRFPSMFLSTLINDVLFYVQFPHQISHAKSHAVQG